MNGEEKSIWKASRIWIEGDNIMKRLLTIVLFTILFATSALSQRGGVKQQLIKLDQEWASATARGDARVLNRILASDYRYTDLDGSVGTKAQLLRDIRANSKMSHPSLATDDYDIQVYGNTAVMTHLATGKHDDHNTQLRSLHVWVKKGVVWQVVAHQWTTIRRPSGAEEPFRARCANYSYQPEVIAYFGDSNTISEKLDNDHMGLPDRRGYLLLVETKGTSELAFFEREDEHLFKVYKWEGSSLGNFREDLTNVILENRGIACVGAQAKSMVKVNFNPSDLGTIPMPLSAKAAFSHILKKYSGDQYLRVTVLLLC